MESTQHRMSERAFMPQAELQRLIELLGERGYTVVAPTLLDGVIGLRPVESVGEIAQGVRDRQDGGTYRLEEGDEELMFEYVVGPDSPKRYFFPPSMRLCQFVVKKDGFELVAGPPQVPRLAFLGVRACELAAIRIQDRVFGQDDPRAFRCESEPYYAQARREALFIAVNCTRPGGTCFCSSWGTGPQAREGFDLALTELRDGFVTDVGSEAGAELLSTLKTRAPSQAEVELAELKMELASRSMGRSLEVHGVKELLETTYEAAEWDRVAERCTACGNCTMVCPTCFCSTVTDATELADRRVSRNRQWESCFTDAFSYTTSGPGRETVRGRYRHWLRHKLCTWWDQFGTSGCVGCGRCITWCPVGIDLTQEVERLRAENLSRPASSAPARERSETP